MKIAVTAEGQHLTSRVDPRFGRAKWFVVYDTESDEYEAHNNVQVFNLPQGAGIQAAQHIIDKQAGVLLTGHCGPNAYRTLEAGGVQVVINATGTVQEAIERYKQGELAAATGPDVEGHW